MKLFNLTDNTTYKNRNYTKLHIFNFIFTIVFILLTTMLYSDNIIKASAKNINITFETDDEGTTAIYKGKSNSIILDDNKISLNEFPAIKKDNLWMVPVNEFLVNEMLCIYNFNEDDNSFCITDTYNNHTIKYVVGSSIMICDNKKINMGSPVIKGTNTTTGSIDYYVPASITIKSLGYAYSSTSSIIKVKTLVAYNLFTNDTSFDKNIYSNLITNITLAANESNSKYIFNIKTLKKISQKDVLIHNDFKEYSVETVYKKTKNTFGYIYQKIYYSKIVKKIKIWESKDHNTHIKLWYDSHYEYKDKILSHGTSITTKKINFSIRAGLPDNVHFNKISTVDRYWANEFIINIPGNHKKYYSSCKPVINNSAIKKITISRSGNTTKLTVKTKSLCGYKLISQNGFFTVKVGNPKSIYSKIVLLDAGHGGMDGGACRKGLKEKNLNLEIIYTRLKKYLNAPSSDIKAYWTRHNDRFINLFTRPALSKKYNADLFISLHMNSSLGNANGTEVYYSYRNNSVTSTGLSSKKAARIMLNTLVTSLNSKNRGVKQDNLVVVKYNSVPAILIELGYISGSSDRKKLKNASYREKSAKTIYKGIKNIFKKYPTGR